MKCAVAGAVYNFNLARLLWVHDQRGIFTPQIIPEYRIQPVMQVMQTLLCSLQCHIGKIRGFF